MTSIFPANQNKETFKAYLRTYKDKFSDNILSSRFKEVSGMLNAYHNSLTPNTNIEVILFDYSDTVNISNRSNLLYIPGLENDVINLRNGSTTKSIKITSNGVEVDSTQYTIGTSFLIENKTYTVYGTGGVLLYSQGVPTYSITESSTSVNEGASVTFTILTTDVADGTVLYYAINGTVSSADFTDASLSGSVTVSGDSASFTKTLVNDLSRDNTEGTETFEVELRTSSITGTIVATSNTITVSDTSFASYTLTQSSTSVSEGDTVTFTVNTVGIPDGTTLYYTTSGSVSSSDISSTSGSFVINSDTGSFTLSVIEDILVESSETLEVDVRTGSLTGEIVVSASTITVTNTTNYVVSISSNVLVEGDVAIFTVDTQGVPDNTTLYYVVTGSAASTVDLSSLSGSFIINNDAGSFNITVNQDYESDDAESFTVEVKTGSVSGTVVDSIGPITITESAFTMDVIPQQTVIPESTITTPSSLTFDVTTTGISDGTSFTATIVGGSAAVNSADFNGSLTKSFTVNNNSASFIVSLVRDGKTEGTETFTVQVKNQNGTVIATSPVVVITDASFTGSRKTDKTFGPIPVNRDNGNTANTSDWYTLCSLDNIPNGSKIVLFLDNSGSMTTDTVRASLNEFLIKLQQRDITIEVVENSTEDWITPFDKDIL